MHFEVRHVIPNTHFYIKLAGEVSLGDIAVELKLLSKTLSKLNNPYYILWDLTETIITELSFDAVDAMAKDILNTMQHGEGKSAYYIGDRGEKHLLNFLAGTLRSEGYMREVGLFHEIEQARKYLGFPVEETV